MSYSVAQRLAAEAIGTAILVCAVVGSGIMADALSADDAVSLLGNTIPTGAILVVLIAILGPVSGAHLNPAVTFVFALQRTIPAAVALAYMGAQVAGGIAGTLLAQAMFDLPVFEIGTKVRSGGGQWIAEAVATFGLVAAILGGLRFRPENGTVACRPLHHRGLLVHRVDKLCQSRRRHRTRSDRYLRRNPSRRRSGLRHVRGGRRGAGRGRHEPDARADPGCRRSRGGPDRGGSGTKVLIVRPRLRF